jgi:hypothetical protein
MKKLLFTAAIVAAIGLPSIARAQTAAAPESNCRPAAAGEKPTGTINNTQVVCSSNAGGDSTPKQSTPPANGAQEKQAQVMASVSTDKADRKAPYPGFYDTSVY